MKCILFVVMEGGGLGHLTRALAIARRLKKMEKEYEIIFFTDSPATEVVRQEGYLYYHIPLRSALPNYLKATHWTTLFQKILQTILSYHKPEIFVYEGVYPYAFMLSELAQHKGMKKIWIKRECYKSGITEFVNSEALFDQVIIPGELFQSSTTQKNRILCNPITLIDPKEANSREKVRNSLGIKEKELLVYIQLGALSVKNAESYLVCQQILLNYKNVRPIIAESILETSSFVVNPRSIRLRHYPNSEYFNSLDAAIIAPGYNTFYEMASFLIPSIYIPNKRTYFDDQQKRAQMGVKAGIGICMDNFHDLKEEFDILRVNRDDYLEHLRKRQWENGALQAAASICDQIRIN